MLTRQIALVSETNQTNASDVSSVGAALQKQVTRDFAPIWEIQATVDTFPTLDDVPLGYWPIVVRDDIKEPGAAGVHQDNDGQPIALVQVDQGWSLTASHECLEMLADPFGNRLIAGPSPKTDQGRVEFLVEVCDPSESATYGYSVNGVLVSDFYTPNFFDPVPNSAVRYSFTGGIKEPRKVLEGGYLSWHEPASDHWWQEIWFSGPAATFRDLGVLGRLQKSVRETIYEETTEARGFLAASAKDHLQKSDLLATVASANVASRGKAAAWRRRITEIRNELAKAG